MTTQSKRARTLAAALEKSTPAEPTPPAQVSPPVTAKPERPRQVGMQIYLHQADHERLRDIAYHGKTTLQQLGIEALNLLMASRGHAPLTPATNNRPTGRNAG